MASWQIFGALYYKSRADWKERPRKEVLSALLELRDGGGAVADAARLI